jgi:hypothetical protein
MTALMMYHGMGKKIKKSYTENRNDIILNSCFFTIFSRKSGSTGQSIFSTFNTTVNRVRVILTLYCDGVTYVGIWEPSYRCLGTEQWAK